jgi:heparan-alpha-glucosaminide N-acetyltransferase
MRVRSLDLLRGADVLLMLFVNEVAYVRDAPWFLLHVRAGVDGMTITDVVFPAFMFIVGVAIPFALASRLRRGDTRAQVLRHVLGRAAALLVMGVLMVNAEHGVRGQLSAPLWTLVATAGVLLLWGAPEPGWGPLRRPWLRAAGSALLLVAVLAYRSPDATGWIQLRPHWWGILGLIGWAYLSAAALYLAVGERPAALTGLVALLYCVALAQTTGGLGPWAVRPLVGPLLGTDAAIVLAGTLLGVLLRRQLESADAAAPHCAAAARPLVVQAAALAAGLAAAGLLLHTLNGLHPAFRVSKLGATAPWGLLCSALTAAAWLLVFLAADVAGWQRWPRSCAIAGENPLVAYMLAPALFSAFAVAAPLTGGRDLYAAARATPWVGLAVSAVFAWVVVRLTGFLRSRGLRVQL